MEGQTRKIISPTIVAAIFIQIIFIIVVVLSIKQIIESNQPKLEVKVTGLTSEIRNITDNGKESIEYSIYQAISENSPTIVVDKNGVDIREGSLIEAYYEDADVHYVSFIADVPTVNQSYRVAHIWSTSGNNKYVSPNVNVAVTCLPKEQLIFGDFECNHKQDGYKKDILLMIIQILHGKLKIDDDEYLSLTIAKPSDNSSDLIIRINYSSCDSMCVCKKASEADKQRALNRYNEFIRGLGYAPEDFAHYFYDCEDDSMYLTEDNTLIR